MKKGTRLSWPFMVCTIIQMTDEGLDEKLYLTQIKQLRFNFTHFDVNDQTPEVKEQVLDAINHLGGIRNSYEIIQTYEWAAHECKDRKDPENDK